MIELVVDERIRYSGYEIDHRLSGRTAETLSLMLEDPDIKHRYEFVASKADILIGNCILNELLSVAKQNRAG